MSSCPRCGASTSEDGCPFCRGTLVAATPGTTDTTRIAASPGEDAIETGPASDRLAAIEAPDLPAQVLAARGEPRRVFGRFLLLSELGRGGMGAGRAGPPRPRAPGRGRGAAPAPPAGAGPPPPGAPAPHPPPRRGERW